MSRLAPKVEPLHTAAERKAAHHELRAYGFAAEECDVSGAAVDFIANQIAKACSGKAYVKDTPAWATAEWEARPAPWPEAVAHRDKVVAFVEALRVPACVTIEVSDVVRIRFPDWDDDGRRVGRWVTGDKSTGVVVHVTSPVTARRDVLIPGEK